MLTIIQTALEAGFLYAPVAMALFLSFSILNIADMTTDGAFVLGSAVSAMMCLSGHPVLALPAGMLAAAAAGFVTAFLQTKLSVPSILAGIITNIGLYSVNLMVMGKSNQSLFQTDTIYTLAKGAGFAGSWYKVAVTALIVLALAALVIGETLIGKGGMVRRVLGVVVGSILYRLLYAAALRFNVPADYMKLVSAVIVAAAIAAPAVRRWAAFQRRKAAARAERGGM